MVAMTMTKPKTKSTMPDFEAAKARWAEVDAKRSALVERHDGMELALNYARNGVDKRVPKEIRAKAGPHNNLANRNPQKLAGEIDDVAYEIADSNAEYGAERERWQAASRDETARIAQELQPRHRAAVQKIAGALEDLSRAMEAETGVRAELTRTAPEATSAYLPDCSSFLNFASLAVWQTPASQWARHMRKMEIL